MNKNILIAVGVILVLVAAGYFLMSGPSSTPTKQTPQQNQASTTPVVKAPPAPVSTTTAPKTVVIKYTSKGFEPTTITIAKGDIIKFVSDSNAKDMWIASDLHPAHSGYDGTNKTQHCAGNKSPLSFDECEVGKTYSFTFDKIGTWGYHNHSNFSDKGTIVVK